MRFSVTMTAERFLPAPLALRLRPLSTRVDAALFSADERGEAGRMSLIAFSIRVVSAVIAFVSQVLLARWMGSFEYGIFVLVWTTMIIAGNLACLGSHTSIIRFIQEYRAKGMLPELRGLLLAGRLFSLVAATLMAGLGALGIWLLADRIESYYLVPFLLGVICMPMVALSDLLQGVSRAFSGAISALSPTYLTRPILILVCMAGALFAGYPATATTAMLAAIAATYLTTILQLASVTTHVDRKLPSGPRRMQLGNWFAVSAPIFLVESFFFILTNADVLMVGAYLDPHDVAIYFATVKTLALVHFVYFAVKAGAAQRYAQFTHGEPERLAAFARETVTWTFWPSVAMAAVVLVLGKPMLMLFGPGFDSGFPLLFVLTLGVVARAAVGPCESLLTMSGNQNICALVYALTLALNVGLNMLLIPQLGLWGAAIATAAAMLFEASALSFTVWRRLGIVMAIFIPAAQPQEAG